MQIKIDLDLYTNRSSQIFKCICHTALLVLFRSKTSECVETAEF